MTPESAPVSRGNVLDPQAIPTDMATSCQDTVPDVDDVFVKPVWFIAYNEGKGFQCNPSVLRQLERVTKRLVVIAVTGKYRTGKSYLLNRLADSKTGFPLGPTVEAKTKGIWIWCREHPFKADQVIVLLDTEGLGDIRKLNSLAGDSAIMTLSVLLSSCFVYNIMKVFNTDALQQIECISHVAKKMSTSNFPQFVLALRDFTLELGEDSDGEPRTADSYLTECLADDPADGNREFNRTRKCVRESFPDRRCFLFDTPCSSRSKMKNLENLTDEDLSVDFIEQSNEFLSWMLAEAQVKHHGRTEADGHVFCLLVKKCVVDINNGVIPSIEDLFVRAVRQKNEEAFEAAVEVYRDNMTVAAKKLTFHKSFDRHHFKSIDQAISTRNMVLGTFEVLEIYADKFEVSIMEISETIRSQSRKELKDHFNELLLDMFKDISADLERKRFHNEWGHDNFQVNMEELRTNFEFATEHFGDLEGLRGEVFDEFAKNKEDLIKMLEYNQQSCTDQRIKRDALRRSRLKSERSALRLEKQIERKKQEIDEVQVEHNRSVEAILAAHRRKLQDMSDEYERKVNDHKARLDEELEEETKAMMRERRRFSRRHKRH